MRMHRCTGKVCRISSGGVLTLRVVCVQVDFSFVSETGLLPKIISSKMKLIDHDLAQPTHSNHEHTGHDFCGKTCHLYMHYDHPPSIAIHVWLLRLNQIFTRFYFLLLLISECPLV